VIEPLVLTVEEAAEALRIGRTAAYDAVRRGDIPSVRIGRSVRVPRHQLEALLGLRNGDDPANEKRPAVTPGAPQDSARQGRYDRA
jgi:excisionase family DNA binding protein